MPWPRHTARLPAGARAAIDLPRGERVLAVAGLRDGAWVVATDQGLVGGGWRVPWSSVTHVQWYDDTATLAVASLEESGLVQHQSLELAEPGRLPETVHERVTATILLSRHVQVPAGGPGVRIVARRQPGRDEVLWQVVPDPGGDPDAIRADAIRDLADAVRAMRAELGL